MTDERDKSADKSAGSEDRPVEPTTGARQRAGGYKVALPEFEGPLDLLLHLIQQHKLDILDIPISLLAQKYVEYITLMQELNIDLASEYLVMAATLAHIKSKMLLPSVPDDQDDSDELGVDPRAELVRRLLEYQKYKHAAEQFADFDVLGRDVFNRGAAGPSVEGPAPLAPVSLFKLLDAFQRVLERAHRTVDHEIEFERLSITDRINELVDLMRGRDRMPFEALFPEQTSRADLVVTFLALLEMTRLRMTRLVQIAPFDPILVEFALAHDTENAKDSRVDDRQPRASEQSDDGAEASSANGDPVAAVQVESGHPGAPGKDDGEEPSAVPTADPGTQVSPSDRDDVELEG